MRSRAHIQSDITGFVSKADIDKRYLDKPYDITPGGKIGADAFAVIRDAMEDQLVQKDHTNPISSHT